MTHTLTLSCVEQSAVSLTQTYCTGRSAPRPVSTKRVVKREMPTTQHSALRLAHCTNARSLVSIFRICYRAVFIQSACIVCVCLCFLVCCFAVCVLFVFPCLDLFDIACHFRARARPRSNTVAQRFPLPITVIRQHTVALGFLRPLGCCCSR